MSDLTPREFAVNVTRKLQSAGYQALWAGGCVRDQLLDKEPKDYDVATSATPDQIRELFGRKRTLTLGAAFGVITVIGPKSAGNIEVATFRRDADYSDGRRPDSVEFSTAETDAQRRDFTINGLFFDPGKDEVIDYVGGQVDLKKRIIRAIGNPAERIAEDKLRMLRAVRFASNLSFQLDDETKVTVQRHADEIGIVSAERISAELKRMLENENRVQAVELLCDTGLLAQILPESSKSFALPIEKESTLTALGKLLSPTFTVALTTLLHNSVSPIKFAKICRRLKLPNEVTDGGQWMLTHSSMLQQADQLPWSTVQPLLVHERAGEALEFVAACFDAESAMEFARERLQWPVEKLNPPTLIDGGVLQQRGVSPGPQFKLILDRVRRAQLDGEIDTVDDAIEMALQIINAEPET